MTPAIIFLWLTVVMPGRQPDIEGHFKWQSATECWKEAQAFLDQGVTDAMKEMGAIAVKAGCSTDEHNEKS